MCTDLKSTMRLVALAALIVGLGACAKYPAVVTAGANPGSMPAATAPAPIPPR